jgi:hypothetical protein
MNEDHPYQGLIKLSVGGYNNEKLGKGSYGIGPGGSHLPAGGGNGFLD